MQEPRATKALELTPRACYVQLIIALARLELLVVSPRERAPSALPALRTP